MERAAFATLLLAAACGTGIDATESKLYPTCPELDVAPGALAAKAATFDELAVSLHLPPGQDLMHSVILSEDLSRIETIDPKDNTGLWTSAYTASQAYRYAATHDPVALANLKRVLRGHRDLMLLTGVPGLFARSYIDTRLPAFPTEASLELRYGNCDLSRGHCKKWIRSTVPGFENLLWKNDTSKDEYAGHMFAIGVAGELVDDPEVRGIVRELATETARHLMRNHLEITDFDGALTTYGAMSPLSLTEYPGFNAALTLSWFRVAATLSGDPEITSYYENCLLHRDLGLCPDPIAATETPYPEHLAAMGLDLGCQTNWNNHNMAQLAMFPLIRYETQHFDARHAYQRALEVGMWSADDPMPMKVQGNTLFTYFHEVNKLASAEPTDLAMNDAVCTLKRYPAEKYRREVDTSKSYREVCRDRRDHPLTDVIIPIDERQLDNFIWTLPPYRIETEPGNRRDVQSPEDYLLAYWLGRYYGFLPPDL